jgi:hypothetical protein
MSSRISAVSGIRSFGRATRGGLTPTTGDVAISCHRTAWRSAPGHDAVRLVNGRWSGSLRDHLIEGSLQVVWNAVRRA